MPFSAAAREVIRRTRSWSRGRRYIAATALVGAVSLIRWVAEPLVHSSGYFFFQCAVAMAAIVLDWMSSIWATTLSSFVIAYVFSDPHWILHLDRDQAAGLLLFILSCLVISAVGEAMRSLANQLEATQHDKDILFRELQHRTRNNLQVIGSAIAIQTYRAQQKETRDALRSIADRMLGIARVHEHLHRPGGDESVDAAEYFQALVTAIGDTLVGQRPVTLTCNAEARRISRDLAESLGISLNELVTNAIKHAFPEGQPGSIDVQFKTSGADLILTVTDDGRGCPVGKAGGTGWKLVNSIIRKHNGELRTEEANPGCRAVVRISQMSGAGTV